MQDGRVNDDQPAIVRFVRGLLRPVEPFGDYFERLDSSVKSSAPLCTTCG